MKTKLKIEDGNQLGTLMSDALTEAGIKKNQLKKLLGLNGGQKPRMVRAIAQAIKEQFQAFERAKVLVDLKL